MVATALQLLTLVQILDGLNTDFMVNTEEIRGILDFMDFPVVQIALHGLFQTLKPTAVVVLIPLLLPMPIPLLTAMDKALLMRSLLQTVRDDYTKYIQSDRSNTYAKTQLLRFSLFACHKW